MTHPLDEAEALLKPFLEQRVFRPLDYRFALSLARMSPTPLEPEAVLAAAAASAALSRGDICLELDNIADQLRPNDEQAPLRPDIAWPPSERLRRAIAQSPLVSQVGTLAPLILEGKRLYLHRYHHYQTRLARALALRAARRFAVDETQLELSLDRLFAAPYDDADQRKAAKLATQMGLTIISGGPGTGKTTTVVRILAALLEQNPKLRATLVAPTGKAAARLGESIREQRKALDISEKIRALIPEEGATIHRTLGFQPANPTRFFHNDERPLNTDLVILDEASMVDLALMTKLVEAVPEHARLIMLGDKDQLASVEAGHVLGDIGQAARPGGPLHANFASLTRTHRFKTDGGIGLLARAIQDGNVEQAIYALNSDPNTIQWISQPEANSLKAVAVEGWSKLSEHAHSPTDALKALGEFQLLTAHRRGDWGAESLNLQIQRWLAQAGFIPDHNVDWYPGKPIIISVNAPQQDLWNGDTGITLLDQERQQPRVFFPSANPDETRSFTIAQLPSHAPLYAMTIHKAQGSGFKHVVTVLPPEVTPVITRELLYTAVTRAKEKLTLLCTREVLEHAISTRVTRASGLYAALETASGQSRLISRPL